MSIEYDNYLNTHRSNVYAAADWFRNNLPELANSMSERAFFYPQIDWDHDSSKDTPLEYDAYDRYFYGGKKTKEVKEDFDKAWLHHIHHNPHHWQYWVLINDESEEGTVAVRMPMRYVLEMICDWWSFSFSKGDLYEIFDWYDKHKDHMILHADTRELINDILGQIKIKLDEEKCDEQA